MNQASATIDETAARFIASQRVAHLATAEPTGAPHVVPICFVLEGARLYTALDSKPKRVGGRDLKRVRNIASNPKVALVFDRYREDWDRIGYVLVTGLAALVEDEAERAAAETLLRAKYRQYRSMLAPGSPVIRIDPVSVVKWGDLGPDPAARSGGDSLDAISPPIR
jgi:PPOX class probable F420-dependent enzyme